MRNGRLAPLKEEIMKCNKCGRRLRVRTMFSWPVWFCVSCKTWKIRSENHCLTVEERHQFEQAILAEKHMKESYFTIPG